jgi:hypothetical protein
MLIIAEGVRPQGFFFLVVNVEAGVHINHMHAPFLIEYHGCVTLKTSLTMISQLVSNPTPITHGNCIRDPLPLA